MATVKKKAAEKAEIKLVKEPIMYVGPTITRLGVIKNVIYTDIPESAKPALTEKPLMKALFVLVTDYPGAEKSIREQSGYIWSAYKCALEYQAELKRR